MHKDKKTYNTPDSHIVTDCSTSGALQPLNSGVRTGPVALIELWSYVKEVHRDSIFVFVESSEEANRGIGNINMLKQRADWFQMIQ